MANKYLYLFFFIANNDIILTSNKDKPKINQRICEESLFLYCEGLLIMYP